MKKKVFALQLLALLMVCLASIVTSCDWLESSTADDTEIVVKNTDSSSSWYITEIDVKDDSNKQVYFSSADIAGPYGQSGEIDVDGGGTYRVKLTVQQKGYTLVGTVMKGEKKYYTCSGNVPNGKKRTVSFDGKSLSFD